MCVQRDERRQARRSDVGGKKQKCQAAYSATVDIICRVTYLVGIAHTAPTQATLCVLLALHVVCMPMRGETTSLAVSRSGAMGGAIAQGESPDSI